jgi:hypothetical protein
MRAVTYTIETLDAIIAREMDNYRCELNSLRLRIEETDHRFARGRVSTHDGFNLSATAGKLQEQAAKIELLLQIRGEATDACPGCGSQPGDGAKSWCVHPDGCGSNIVATLMPDKFILTHVGTGKTFHAGSLGAEMWDRLTRLRESAPTLASFISNKYGVDVEVARRDVDALIKTKLGE